MKKRYMAMVIITMLWAGCYAAFTVSAEGHAPAYSDDSTVFGDNLGKNHIKEYQDPQVKILGKNLYIHESSDLTSDSVAIMTQGEAATLLGSENGILHVSYAVMSPSGNVEHIQGWIDERYTVMASKTYIAMHPTPVYVAPADDAKMIKQMHTYDSLDVIYELEDYFCVMINGAVGFVAKD